MQPLVTIVIIAYNEERYVCDAIESALSQTYKSIEIIVVDDGSRDGTLALAHKYVPKIKVITQKNSGNCSFPRNAGLSVATGKYISFLDADDILQPQKIEEQVRLFEKYPSVVAVINDYCNFRSEKVMPNHFSSCKKLLNRFSGDEESCLLAPGEASGIMLSENFTIASSPLFLTSAVRAIGGFCEQLYACEDFHLNYKLGMSNHVVVNKKVLFHRRLHGANMSSNSLKMNKFYYKSRMLLFLQEDNSERKDKLLKFSKKHYLLYVKEVIARFKYKECLSVFSGALNIFLRAKIR